MDGQLADMAALGCDVRIAAEGTKMNCAFIKIGLSGCEMGASYHLPRLVGTSVAALHVRP